MQKNHLIPIAARALLATTTSFLDPFFIVSPVSFFLPEIYMTPLDDHWNTRDVPRCIFRAIGDGNLREKGHNLLIEPANR